MPENSLLSCSLATSLFDLPRPPLLSFPRKRESIKGWGKIDSCFRRNDKIRKGSGRFAHQPLVFTLFTYPCEPLAGEG